jgi:hypothetical protein
MQSIIRFLVVMGLVMATVLLWRPDLGSSAAVPPKAGNNSMEEVERALGSLHRAPPEAQWSKELFQEQLEDAFRRQDPCAVLALLREKAPVSPEDRWAAGMEVLLNLGMGKPDPALLELFAKPSPLYGTADESSRRPETRFFNALLFSGQFEGGGDQRGSSRDNEKAVATLKELSQEEPDNGAYFYFLAQALRQSGEKKQEVDNAYIYAGKAPKFETYYQKLYDRLLGISYRNLATFTWAYVYLHEAPKPNFTSGTRNLRYWASDSDTGKWIGNLIAKKLIDTGGKMKSESPGYLYSHDEYMLGYGLRYGIEGRAEKNWNEYIERMQEARNFISEAPAAVGEAASELYMDQFAGRNDECRWSAWQSLFEAYKAKKNT